MSTSERSLYLPGLQFYLPIILRHFPPSLPHRSVFWTRLVQYRIRIVEVNKHSAPYFNIFQQAQSFFHGNVPHLMRSFSPALNAYELIVTPKSTIEQKQVGTFDSFKQDIVDIADSGKISNSGPRGRLEKEGSARLRQV